jgi:hypothetical protein
VSADGRAVVAAALAECNTSAYETAHQEGDAGSIEPAASAALPGLAEQDLDLVSHSVGHIDNAHEPSSNAPMIVLL